VLCLAKSILAFHKCPRKLQVSNHDLTLEPFLKIVEFILIIFQVIDIEIRHVWLSLNCFYDVSELERGKLPALLFKLILE
jgi:hypothetical protein